MSERTPELWGREGDESLHCTDIDEAIEEIIDGLDIPYPEKIEVCGYARMEIDIDHTGFLDNVLETLDEEYGDSEMATEPTEAMKQAEKVFLEAIKKEYVPWGCEVVCKREIVVADWLRNKG